jgi:hypothetical protein
LFHIVRDNRGTFAFRQKSQRGCVVQHSKIELLMPGSGQNLNPPRSGLCQLPTASDISCLTQAVTLATISGFLTSIGASRAR